jgi:Lrp/AsnC family transcriptional regulator, leucine-responsive regulatory protein
MTPNPRDKRSLDDLDREILRLLRDDGRAAYRTLGAAVGLSANAVADRVRRMKRNGVIAGFMVITNPTALEETLEAIIDVQLAPDQDDPGFEEAIARLPNVLEDVHLTGRTDHQLRVACRDVSDLNQLLRILKRTCGVRHTDTRVILQQSLNRRPAQPRPTRRAKETTSRPRPGGPDQPPTALRDQG